ncbi:hypothetical protein [Paenibacillus solani]|uniref:Uncharacterized protein n=1 Tax=Paenibacillus solani TaxID=1705565 RepID=A0A0M1P7T3_9BACL|nr:hypothetical protein [Paenibacillus solani]KOR90099.1 hypothetical protein AM231_13770 [Paenibacillus solani]
MGNGKQDIAEKINQELEDIRFHGADKVISRTFPKSGRERLASLWNKEIEIRATVIGYVSASVFVLVIGIYLWKDPVMKPAPSVSLQAGTELLEVGGSIYWKDQYERMVARLEDSDQD